MIKKVAILTNGGDCSGLNAVINAVVKTAESNGIECYGYIDGYNGLLENNYIRLSSDVNTSGIIHKGGTIIGSSNNMNVFNVKVEKNGITKYEDYSDKCINNMKKEKIDCLFAIGGDGTLKSARDLSVKGAKVIGIPKTIDNDVPITEITFGHDTAVETATQALDRLHTTAESHNRVMVLEVMGRYAGWIALQSAIAGGADVALIPEIPYDINKVAEKILDRKENDKNFSIVVVSEGAKAKDGDITVKELLEVKGIDNIKLGGIGDKIATEIEELTGITSRNTTLGYLQRGGTPTAYDRILATKYGTKAMELAMEGKFNVLVILKNNKLDSAPLEIMVGKNKEIGAVSGNTKETNIRTIGKNDDLIKTARSIGVCLGD